MKSKREYRLVCPDGEPHTWHTYWQPDGLEHFAEIADKQHGRGVNHRCGPGHRIEYRDPGEWKEVPKSLDSDADSV